MPKKFPIAFVVHVLSIPIVEVAEYAMSIRDCEQS